MKNHTGKMHPLTQMIAMTMAKNSDCYGGADNDAEDDGYDDVDSRAQQNRTLSVATTMLMTVRISMIPTAIVGPFFGNGGAEEDGDTNRRRC